MFKTTSKGFTIKFANGNTVSVQWGQGNYCENRYDDHFHGESRDAEVIAWNEAGEYIMEAQGWQSPEEVSALIEKVSKL